MLGDAALVEPLEFGGAGAGEASESRVVQQAGHVESDELAGADLGRVAFRGVAEAGAAGDREHCGLGAAKPCGWAGAGW